MRVKATAPIYIHDTYHEAGDILEVEDESFNETVMEPAPDDAGPTRSLAAKPSPSAPLPPSGGREKGVESEDLLPQLDPGMDDDDRGGKGGSKKKR